MNIDREEIVVFREDPGQKQSSGQVLVKLEPEAPFQYNLVYCSPPLYGRTDARRVYEWFEFHQRLLAPDKYVLYDAGAFDDEHRALLGEFFKRGLIEVTDFRESEQYHEWLWAQGLAVMDCAFRHRFSAQWVFMHDFDEYLSVSPPATVRGLLDEHRGKPYITHGCMVWSIHKCDNGGGWGGDDSAQAGGGKRFAVERMPYHWPHAYCMNKEADKDTCIDQYGHRKYIVDPRQFDNAEIHRVVRPAEGGVDMSVQVLRHHHYQGLATKSNAQLCVEPHDEKDTLSWWVQDTSVADFVASHVRPCPLGSECHTT
eukprot:jgi/Mesen1/4758/ME000242S03933